MTVESFPGPARYTVSGTGPYAIGFAYTSGAVRVRVWSAGVLTDLVQGTDYTVSPAEGQTGDVTLSSAAATAHDGASLYVDRATEIEQGWAAAGGAREAGLEAQLDRLAAGLQEAKAELARSLRLNDGQAAPYTPEPGHVPLYDAAAQAFVNGPTADEVEAAQGYAQELRNSVMIPISEDAQSVLVSIGSLYFVGEADTPYPHVTLEIV